MNCEDYIEAIAADPYGTIEGGAEHVASCASCATFLADMQAMDNTIVKALAISVPEMKLPELPSVGEDDNVVSIAARQKPGFSMPTWVGLAAGVVLAAVVTFQYMPDATISEQDLAGQILAHMDHEPWAMVATNVAVSEDRVDRVFSQSGGTMEAEIGLVSYASSCIINGRQIPHLVIQGKNGPVTLLLMPEEMVSSPISIDGEGVQGVILPFGEGGSGSIALIGEREFNAEELKDRVVNSVEWSI